MVGYIGPNGAGKSTTIKMLIGILVPSRGSVRVDGIDPSRDRIAVARRIGVVFGQRTQLWWDLPLADSFELLRHVYRVPAADHGSTLGRMVDLLDMGPFLATPVRQLSLGQRMRGELAAAMLHRPPVLFLDEPTIGLDVVSKEAVRTFLGDLHREHGHDGAADDPRPRRRGAAVRAARRDRPRPGDRGRHGRGHQGPLRHRAHRGGRPGRARSAARDPGDDGRPRGGARASGCGSGATSTRPPPSSPPSPPRSRSATSPSRSRPSTPSSAASTPARPPRPHTPVSA